MTDVILGIQIGSSKVRVKAYDLSGGLRAKGVELLRIYHEQPHHHELDAEELWSSTCTAIQKCMQELKEANVLSIGVSSVGESHVMLDQYDAPLGRVIVWYDQRATQQTAALRQCIGEEKIYGITGQFISPKFGICKSMWIRDNMPELYAKIRSVLTLHDYIIYRLTGKKLTEYSVASRMMCFNIEKLEWSKELLQFAKLSEDCFPEVVPGASAAGGIRIEASRLTGLQTGIPVFTGGHDHACAAVAVNIFQDDVMLDSMGSAETTMVAMENRLDMEKGFQNQIAVYPHFGSKLFRAVTSIQAFGVVFDWLKRWMYGGEAGVDDALFLRLLQQINLDDQPSKNLLFMPHLRGLQEFAGASGVFFGIDETCSCQTMVRAVAEGLSFELRRRTDACEKAFGRDFYSVRAVGEYSSQPLLMSTKSAIIAKQIETISQADAITYGAALMGALGAGIISEADLQDFFRPNGEYVSEYRAIKRYQKKYEQYLKVFEQLLPVYALSNDIIENFKEEMA